MKKSVQIALASTALAVAGAAFMASTAFAQSHTAMRLGGHPAAMGSIGHRFLQDIDTDGDGALSQAEIDAAVNGRLAEFDADGNGALSLAEFEALWASLTQPVAVRAFQHLDPDGDASVTAAELGEHFGSLVAHFDRDDDGVLSPDDRRGPMRGAAPHRRGFGFGWFAPRGGQGGPGQSE
jgi:hypothetical protein